ncbi:MAG: DinB family protein [Roseiflexaceae bacterium]
MTIRARFLHFIAGFVFERPVRRLSADQIRQRLSNGVTTVVAAMRAASDTHTHQRVATHIIGIERWGQARLRELLTRTHTSEEYDHYRPAVASMTHLADLMTNTRAETIAVFDQLCAAGITTTQVAHHNMFGAMTLAGWLQYLNAHASLESRKLRK